MKKILLVAVVLLAFCGCSMENVTPDNPMGFNDPNVGATFFTAGFNAARAGQAVGTATGNPAIVAGSTLVLLALGGIGAKYLQGNKNGTS